MKGRKRKALSNILSNFGIMMTKTILSFVTRTIFIKTLGETALGINGLFSNILSMLSLAELGIGTAINFSLYQPLAKKDTHKISVLMSFYKKIYSIIGVIEFVLGIALIPFLRFFIKDINSLDKIYIIYFIYLINTASSYFVSYKETLINADQKGYELAKFNIIGLIILNLLQIIFLILTQNYVLYLLIQFIIQLLQRIIINIYIGKKYNNIKFNCKEKLDIEDKKIISKNVKAMFFHKIGDYCVNGTDNIVISSFIDIGTVGIYSNYLMIVNLLNGFITNAFNSVTSSLGNLIVTENDKKKNDIFDIMNFSAFVLYGGCSVCLLSVLPEFISIWIGPKYNLNLTLTIIIVLNFYLTGMRAPVHSLKSASGLYDADKYTPIIQAATNLIVSIILVRKIGLLGVLLGTMISSIILPCWQRPYLVYKYVIHKSSKKYFVNYTKYILITVFCMIITSLITNFLIFDNKILKLFVDGVVSILIFGVAVTIFFKKSEELKYIITMLERRM